MSDMRDAIGVLLAGGQGERLWPLTRDRAKPAVPFGGLYRIIDITLSNCINSDLRRVFVLTQYKALSLNRHIRAGWSALARAWANSSKCCRRRCACRSSGIRARPTRSIRIFIPSAASSSKYVFILSGDHIYKMNYSRMLSSMWIPARMSPWPPSRFRSRRPLAVWRDRDGQGLAHHRLRGKARARQSSLRINPDIATRPWASTFSIPHLLIPILLADAEDPKSHHDFGKDILPRIISQASRLCVQFRRRKSARTRCTGATSARSTPTTKPTWTCQRLAGFQPVRHDLAAAHLAFTSIRRRNLFSPILSAWASRSIPSSPAARIISGGRVMKSVLGADVRVNSYSEVSESIIYNHVNVGRHSRIRRAIIDRHVSLPSAPRSATTWKPTSAASTSPTPASWSSSARNP